MKKIGDTVRYRDEKNTNFTALVIAVHSETVLSLVYCPKAGEVKRVDSVKHRSMLNPKEEMRPNVAPPPGAHWLG